MKKIINEAVTFVTNVIKLRVARLRLRYASYLAMEKHKATGKQYFVLPYSNGKLKVLSTDEIGAMKKGIRVKARTKDGKQTKAAQSEKLFQDGFSSIMNYDFSVAMGKKNDDG